MTPRADAPSRRVRDVVGLATKRVVREGLAPRQAVDRVDDGILHSGEREDAVALVERATVKVLLQLAEQLDDLDVEDGDQL